MARLHQVQDFFPTDEELVEAWADACPGWADLVSDIGEDLIEEQEIDDLELGLAFAWGILGGADQPTAGLHLDVRKLRLGFDDAWSRFEGLEMAEDILPHLNSMRSGRPELFRVICLRLIAVATQRGDRPGAVSMVGMVLAAWLDAAVPELERALR